MKQFYYFSKSKLKFVEIRNFYSKFIFLILFFSLVSSFVLFGTYFVIKEIINPDAEVSALQSKNNELKNKLESYGLKFEQFRSELKQLSETNDDLRLAVNLDPVNLGNEEVGSGGSLFDENLQLSVGEVGEVIDNIDEYVEKIRFQLNFEKQNYADIEETMKMNEELYASIPAIIPTDGPYGDRFGMRLHPILKVRRMHPGLDIVVNTGAPVYAPGAGRVVFAGRRGGYGNTLEIDHGFGYTTLYAHLSKILVKRGQKVTRGDEVAVSGNSGKLSTGPHLHYEVRHNGIALNPSNFIYDDVNLFELVKQ